MSMMRSTAISTSPVAFQRYMRPDTITNWCSFQPFKLVPVAYAPLLREDAVKQGNILVSLEMAETSKFLMNVTRAVVSAYFVPFLAFDRFDGMDDFNRSYAGEPRHEGESVVPFIETMPWPAAGDGNDIMETLGLHAREGEQVNSALVEGYNVLENWRRASLNNKLGKRNRMVRTLAPAHWDHSLVDNMVTDYDQSQIDGIVPITLAKGSIPVKGIGVQGGSLHNSPAPSLDLIESVDGERVVSGWRSDKYQDAGQERIVVESVVDEILGSIPNIRAELDAAGIELTLSSFETAKKTAAYATLRKKYDGLRDEHIIEILMEGIRVPDAQLEQPILLDQKKTIFGMNQRFATDSDNLTNSVTDGLTQVQLRFATPPMNTGGIIYITVEVTPEQIFERQRDEFLLQTDHTKWPNRLRDELDETRVDVVPNEFIDVAHDDPLATFAYAPLNHAWHRKLVKVGGHFHRPDINAGYDENRDRLWVVEQANPRFTQSLLLCAHGSHTDVFFDTVSDPFEATVKGQLIIEGLTVNGPGLQEAGGHYDAIVEAIDKPTPQEATIKPSE